MLHFSKLCLKCVLWAILNNFGHLSFWVKIGVCPYTQPYLGNFVDFEKIYVYFLSAQIMYTIRKKLNQTWHVFEGFSYPFIQQVLNSHIKDLSEPICKREIKSCKGSDSDIFI